MSDQISKLKEEVTGKWQALDQRERITLIVGSILVLIMVIYSLAWAPMRESINDYRALLPGKRADLVWMQNQAESYKKNKSAKKVSDKPLLTIIEETAQKANLREQIQQMSPGESQNEVKVWLSVASFDEWIRWVDVLSKQHAVIVTAARIQQQEEKLVDIRVSFGR